MACRRALSPRKAPKLDVENRGLDRIEARIYADAGADKAFLPTIFANFAQGRGDSGVVGDGHAPIAGCTEILGRIEAETPNVAD